MMKGFIRGDESFNLLEVEKIECPDGIIRYKEVGTDALHEIEDIVIKESDQVLVVNSRSVPFNVSHFQGTSRERVSDFMDIIKLNSALILPKDLTIVTTFTDPEKSILYQQLKQNGISCINTCDYVEDNGEEWNMVKKIDLIREGLKHVETELVLICDGYDVYINSFDNIIPKFKKTGLRMLYNGTKNNFPWTHVDRIPYRDWRGEYRYFNAGCAIGYLEDFKKFYDDCAEAINEVSNPWESEQFILRSVFAKYSEKVDTPEAYMDFDWKCELFQTYVNAVVLKLYDNQPIYAVI